MKKIFNDIITGLSHKWALPIKTEWMSFLFNNVVLCDVHQTAAYVNNPLSRRFEIRRLTKCMHGNAF